MIKVITAQIPEQGMEFSGDCLEDIFTDLIDDRCKDVSPLMYDLHLQIVRGDLVVKGKSTVIVDAICDCCLVEYEEVIDIENLCHVIEKVDDVVDLTESLREDIVLAIPQSYICRDGCQGICDGCGKNLNKEECICADVELAEDSPWSGLGDIKFD